MPSTRFEASRTTAKASGKISSNVSPSAKRFLNSCVFAANELSLKLLKLGSKPLISSTMVRIFLISRALLLPINRCIKSNKYLNSLGLYILLYTYSINYITKFLKKPKYTIEVISFLHIIYLSMTKYIHIFKTSVSTENTRYRFQGN